jgi:hypothetical protein
MWRWTAIAVIAFLLVDGYVWKSRLLNAGIGYGNQLALAAGFS